MHAHSDCCAVNIIFHCIHLSHILCVRPCIEAQRRRHHQQIIRSVSVPFFRHIAVAAHQREFSHCSVYAAMGKQNKLVHTFSDAHLGWCLHCKYGSILDLCRRQVACVTPGGPCFSSQSRTSSCTRGQQQSQKPAGGQQRPTLRAQSMELHSCPKS